MQSGPLAAPGLYPVADAPEVFQGDTAAEPLRLGHYPFGDPVVDIPLVSPLPSGDLPELAPRRPRAPLLQASAAVDVDPPFFFHRLTAVGLRLAVREQVHCPQVATQVLLHGGGDRDVYLHHLMQDELAPPIAQHRLMATGQPGLRAGGNRDPKAIHRHRAVALVPMLVDGDRPASPKGGLVLSALFVAVRVGDLADDHDSCCRGDLKPLPYLPIGAALERQPVPEAFSERDAGQPVRRGIEPLEPGDQLGGVRRVQTDGLNMIHQYISSIILYASRGNYLRRQSRYSCFMSLWTTPCIGDLLPQCGLPRVHARGVEPSLTGRQADPFGRSSRPRRRDDHDGATVAGCAGGGRWDGCADFFR